MFKGKFNALMFTTDEFTVDYYNCNASFAFIDSDI